MLICLVTFISTLLFLKDTEAALYPSRHCVPTATVRGPCHVCVCSLEGVFHCRSQSCQIEKLGGSRPDKDCEPNFIYREDNVFCTCGKDGYWKSDNCEEKYSYLQPRFTANVKNLKTNVACKPLTFYLIDCNICLCTNSGVIDVTRCTNRHCGQGHKADHCTYGDILRVDQEICACSDIEYYIDRLCTKIIKEVVQPLETNEIEKLTDIGRSWRRLDELQINICDSGVEYVVDCNNCTCIDGYLNCSQNVCEREKKPALRRKKSKEKEEFESLPTLPSDGHLCDPGQKYRINCNTCLCTPDGIPSCTTMVCLEDFVLDNKSLRGALSNS